MKKPIALCLAVLLMLAVVGCDTAPETDQSTNSTTVPKCSFSCSFLYCT